MRTVPFSVFRSQASEILDLVEAGEEVLIQRHGKVVARLAPVGVERTPSWKAPHEPLVVRGVSLSKAILEDRR